MPAARTVQSKTVVPVLFLSLLWLFGPAPWSQGQNEHETNAQKVKADITKLSDQDAFNREMAAADLRNIGPDAVDAVPALMTVLAHDADPGNRAIAAGALAAIGSDAKQAVPALIYALGNDSDDRTRANSAAALQAVGHGAEAAVPALVNALAHDPFGDTRAFAAAALESIGPAANDAGKALAVAVRSDKSDVVRENAVSALGKIHSKSDEVIPALISSLSTDQDETVRIGACLSIRSIGSDAYAAVPQLTTTLVRDSSENLRIGAAVALDGIGPKAKSAVPALLNFLQTGTSGSARAAAALALGDIGTDAKQAVPILVGALSKDPDGTVRFQAAQSIGKLGFVIDDAIPSLTKAFENDKDQNVQMAAAEALVRIAEAARDAKRTQLLGPLSEVEGIFASHSYPAHAKRIHTALDILRAINAAPPAEQRLPYAVLMSHPRIAVGLCVYLLLLLSSLGLLWIFPIILWRINDIPLFAREVKLPDWIGGGTASLAQVLVFGFFRYHPRVLDRWIAEHIATARITFGRMATVSDREIYVDVPVYLNNKILSNLKPADLKSVFENKRVCLLIWGEGGAGKTSLACQIAKWAMSENETERPCPQPMLPVFIEEELNLEAAKDRDVLIEAVRGKLRDLTEAAVSPSAQLVKQLLEQRRVMIILDGMSELNQGTRDKIRPGSPDFSANILVVTSRLDEPLDGSSKFALQPTRVQGNRLSSFMDAYLTEQGKRTLFDDREFFDGCSNLSTLVGDRETTVLLAKLFAEQMIASKERTINGLPDSIPDLMLEYLNQVNRKEQVLEDRLLHSVAKTIAWVCLSRTFRPTPAKVSDVLRALGGGETAETYLKIVEQKLKLIQILGVGRDLVKFGLDPLSEYLAGMYLVEKYRANEAGWSEFLAALDTLPNSSPSALSFLLAVHDCCIVRGPEYDVPGFVIERLSALKSKESAKSTAVEATHFPS